MNSPLMIVPSQLSTGSGSKPSSWANGKAFSSFQINAAPVRFFLKQKEVAILKKIRGGEAAHSATYNDRVVMSRDRRTRENFAITNLMADRIVLPVDNGL